MANPQKENGHIGIATEIIEALIRQKLSGSEWQLIMTVIRKTWGWQKKEDVISLSQFEKSTELHHTVVCRAKKRLVAKNILLIRNNSIKFNKNYEQWLVAESIQVVAKKSLGSSKKVKKVVAKTLHTIDILTIDTNTINIYSHLKDEKFLSSFKDFLKMRTKIRKPTTERAQELILIELQKYDLQTATKMLEQSIIKDWQDVYPLKTEVKNGRDTGNAKENRRKELDKLGEVVS